MAVYCVKNQASFVAMSNYEVSHLSLDSNKIKISLNKSCSEKLKLRKKLLRGLKQLKNYGISGFIQFFEENDNGFIQIYLANPITLQLTNRILSKSSIFEQLINYETYRKIDSFYLTILTIKNTELEEQTVIPVMYLIHEKNDAKVHEKFWQNFVLKKLDYELPIAISKDTNIINGVIECFKTKNKFFFCSKKIVHDANTFNSNLNQIKNSNNDQDIEINKMIHLTTGIENLVSCNNVVEFKQCYKEFSPLWSKEYKEFFDTKLQPLIISNLLRSKNTNLRLNMPKESNQYLFEPITKSDEFSLADLIFKLYLNSCQIVISSNKAHQNGRVKAKFLPYANLNLMQINSTFLNYFDLDKNQQTRCSDHFKPTIYLLFHFQIADIVINNNLVQVNENENNITVKSPFDGSIFKIYEDNGKTVCTCQLNDPLNSKICFHKIAAYYVSINRDLYLK